MILAIFSMLFLFLTRSWSVDMVGYDDRLVSANPIKYISTHRKQQRDAAEARDVPSKGSRSS
jgi:hypothetical protein